MTVSKFVLAAGMGLLALTLACSGSSGSTGQAPVTAATPVITAPAFVSSASVSSDDAFPVSTQAQPGCSFTWSVSDPLIQIVSGQGTPSVRLCGPFTADPETFQVGVRVEAGASVAEAQAAITVADPPTALLTIEADPISHPALIHVPIPAQATTQMLWQTFSWSAQGADVTSGQGTGSVTLTPYAVGTVTVWCQITDPVTGFGAEVAGSFSVFDPAVARPDPQTIAGPAAFTPYATGLVYSVPAQAGCSYSWAVGNGAITAGGASPSITYSAGSVPVSSTLFTCNIRNGGGVTQCTLTVPGVD